MRHLIKGGKVLALAYIALWTLAEPLSFLNLLPPVTLRFRLLYVGLLVVFAVVLFIRGKPRPTDAQPSSAPSTTETANGLITAAQSREIPLASVVSRALEFAQRANDHELEAFCVGELNGWYASRERPEYRYAPMYASFDEVNLQYVGWAGNPSALMQELESDPKRYIPVKFFFGQPLSELEGVQPPAAQKHIIHFRSTARAVFNGVLDTDAPVFVYGSQGTFRKLVDNVRHSLTQHLITRSRGQAV